MKITPYQANANMLKEAQMVIHQKNLQELQRLNHQKEQQIQRDVLEGWIQQTTDGIQENSLLYRVGKVMEFKTRLQEIEARKLKRQLEEAKEKN